MELLMLTFQIPDMTCAHCVKAITQALQAVDASAALEFDLASHQVRVQPGSGAAAADTQRLAESLQVALVEAGYTPTLAPA
jgi:copper chaperone